MSNNHQMVSLNGSGHMVSQRAALLSMASGVPAALAVRYTMGMLHIYALLWLVVPVVVAVVDTRRIQRAHPGYRAIAPVGDASLGVRRLANRDVVLDLQHLGLHKALSPWGGGDDAASLHQLQRWNASNKESTLEHLAHHRLHYTGNARELSLMLRRVFHPGLYPVVRIAHDEFGDIMDLRGEEGCRRLVEPLVVLGRDEPLNEADIAEVSPVPGMGSTSSDAGVRERAMARIAEVDADFERRRFDICEVIEHHALFSMRFEPTRAFEQFRMEVRDTELAGLTDAELRTMATTLASLYAAAVEHAEHVGLDALRDPKAGDTALKMARTATDDRTPQGERDAAAAKLAEALRTLGLPTELTAPALDACGLRRELER